MNYWEVLHEEKPVGKRIVIIGGGPIAVDVAHYLSQQQPFSAEVSLFLNEQHILSPEEALQIPEASPREITILKRSGGRINKKLGKTTGWIHVQNLEKHGVSVLSGVSYQKIDDQGVWITLNGSQQCIPADTVIVAVGQEPLNQWEVSLRDKIAEVHVIGGAYKTEGLDAKHAIAQAAELANRI